MTSQQPLLETLDGVFAWASFTLSLPMIAGLAMMVTGSVREKQHGTALSSQIRLIGWSVLCAFLVGWWLRQLFVPGPGITGGFGDVSKALPWSSDMGSAGSVGGSAWLRFALTSWLVSALVAASLVERIRAASLLLLTGMASAICASVVAAWTWDEQSWLVLLTGTHDAFGAAAIHTLAGGFVLGVLHRIGPRACATTSDGRIAEVPTATPWLQSLGLFLFIIGLFAFTGSVLRPFVLTDSTGLALNAIGPYGTPTSLAKVATNQILALVGGILVGSVLGRGRPHKMLCGGVAGMVGVASGADLYHPLQAFLIAGAVTWFAFAVRERLETRYQVDDALGVISWHGAAGIGSLVVAGFVLWTIPSTASPDAATINPFGNAVAALFAFLIVGYVPAYLATRFLDYLGILRLPLSVEIAGADLLDDLADARATMEAADRERALVRGALAKQGAHVVY